MALRKIREFGDEVLNKECKEVTKMTIRTKVLINDMLDTMYEAMGVGLAAPQVGILKRIVVIDIGEGPIILINPEIIETSAPVSHDSTVHCFHLYSERSSWILPYSDQSPA